MLWKGTVNVFLCNNEKVVEKFDKLSLVTFVGCCHMCLNSLTVLTLFLHDDDDDDDDDDENLVENDDQGHLTGHGSVWVK